MRLRFAESATRWGFAIFLASEDRYGVSALPTGDLAGLPEDALDTTCGLYLDDPRLALIPDEVSVLTTKSCVPKGRSGPPSAGNQPTARARARRMRATTGPDPWVRLAYCADCGPMSRSAAPTERTCPCRWRIRWATSPVHPVWWAAPSPAPLSPWKYSLNTRLSFQAGSRLQPLDPAEAGAPPVRPDEEDRDQPVLEILADGIEGQLVAAARRVLEGQLVAEEPVVALERADEQVVEGEPQRTSPVGVAAEHGRRRLGWLVVDRCAEAVDAKLVGVLAMVCRQRAQPVRGQELVLVEELVEQLLQPLDTGHAQQQPLACRVRRAGARARAAASTLLKP